MQWNIRRVYVRSRRNACKTTLCSLLLPSFAVSIFMPCSTIPTPILHSFLSSFFVFLQYNLAAEKLHALYTTRDNCKNCVKYSEKNRPSWCRWSKKFFISFEEFKEFRISLESSFRHSSRPCFLFQRGDVFPLKLRSRLF